MKALSIAEVRRRLPVGKEFRSAFVGSLVIHGNAGRVELPVPPVTTRRVVKQTPLKMTSVYLDGEKKDTESHCYWAFVVCREEADGTIVLSHYDDEKNETTDFVRISFDLAWQGPPPPPADAEREAMDVAIKTVVVTLCGDPATMGYPSIIRGKLQDRLTDLRKANPLGWRDEFDQRIELFCDEIAQEMGGRYDGRTFELQRDCYNFTLPAPTRTVPSATV